MRRPAHVAGRRYWKLKARSTTHNPYISVAQEYYFFSAGKRPGKAGKSKCCKKHVYLSFDLHGSTKNSSIFETR
jgi:hypothetical protein